ncbi:DUF6207 family protein [Streptomyces sp. NPDC101112]|uniref:DUF6207 family protein n=1 Tax=Streptomyces sp. NPDC101112 TaxID=3366105 RepID=UPI00380B3417
MRGSPRHSAPDPRHASSRAPRRPRPPERPAVSLPYQHGNSRYHSRGQLPGRGSPAPRPRPGDRRLRRSARGSAGLGLGDVAACDEQTAFAKQALLVGRWATASGDRTTCVPGEPGVRLRWYLDVRQELGSRR